MEFVTAHGMRMPSLGFGTWMLTGKNCEHAVRTALDIGYRHIDTAQIYENEEEVGRAIQNGGVSRSELFVTTKLWTTNFHKQDVISSTEESLRKLKMDYVDLLLIHWPNADVPLNETLTAMQSLIAQNKVRFIGVSNFPVAWMKRAVEECKAPIACNQVEYHALLSQRAVLDYASSHDMVVTAYSPLARGRLTNNQTLSDIGGKYNKSANQVALRWLIEQPNVAAIPKAGSEKNARANFNIFDFTLSEEDRAAINALQGNNRTINPGFSPVWDAA